jgi:hypothetical protein
MDTGVFELPNAICTDSGQWVREVELAEMTGEEEDILADQTRMVGKGKLAKRADQRMTEILSRCTVRLGDWRRPDGKDRFNAPTFFFKAWENAYTNDRAFAIIKLRQVSLGDILTVEETCPACGKELKRVEVNLNDLKANPIDFEIACKTHRKVTLPKSKDVVTWRAFTGRDELLLEEIQSSRKSDMLSAVLQARITEVNGVPPSDVLEYVKRLSQLDRRFFSKHIDDAEGGLDTSLQIGCDGCGHEFERAVNIGNKSFFFPSEVG